MVAKLTALGFLKEVRVKRGEPSWRTDEEEKPVGLKITKAGSAAIGVEDAYWSKLLKDPRFKDLIQ